MPLTPEAKVIYVHLAGFLARSYQTPSHSRYDILRNSGMQVFLISCETDHTVAGNCSGFPPDSLLNTGRKPAFHQKRCKIIKFIDWMFSVVVKYLLIGIFP